MTAYTRNPNSLSLYTFLEVSGCLLRDIIFYMAKGTVSCLTIAANGKEEKNTPSHTSTTTGVQQARSLTCSI